MRRRRVTGKDIVESLAYFRAGFAVFLAIFNAVTWLFRSDPQSNQTMKFMLLKT